MPNEDGDVLNDDLEAASDYFQRILDETLPHQQAGRIALEQFGVVLDGKVLNRILQAFTCSCVSMEQCVQNNLHKAGLI
ncbi:MAG: hypothetical protein HOO93_00625 [Methyloglobulus sp.]|nr:hypothetical protein [Methyloglobulus sp.]